LKKRSIQKTLQYVGGIIQVNIRNFSLCSSGSSNSDNITVPGTNSSSTNTELISDNLTRNPTVQAQQPNNGSQQLWPSANEGSSNSFSTVIHTGMDFFHQTAAAAASSDVVQPQLPHQPFQVPKGALFLKFVCL
jgi:hypothetical protein